MGMNVHMYVRTCIRLYVCMCVCRLGGHSSLQLPAVAVYSSLNGCCRSMTLLQISGTR